MQQFIISQETFSNAEIERVLDYCQSDVDATEALFHKLADCVDFERALVRGAYMVAIAVIEGNGVPIDSTAYDLLRDRWDDLKQNLITRIDSVYGVFEQGSFKSALFEQYLIENGIPWPRTESGQLSLSENTFKSMAQCYPKLNMLPELRSTLGKLRLNALRVGRDGRNRVGLSPFGRGRVVISLAALSTFLVRPFGFAA